MPPKKETVVYPASKRKAPPFKPQRPSKVPRIPTTNSESSKAKPTKNTKPTKSPVASRQRQAIDIRDDDDDEDEESSATVGSSDSDSDEELDDDPLASKPKKTKSNKPAPAKRKPVRDVSPMSISSQQSSNASPDRSPAAPNLPPPPSQLDAPPVMPQPLLVRLLHEHFVDKNTKIDKQAIQVLQKYFEVFVRETIARAQSKKKEQVEQAGQDGGTAAGIDVSWLEFEDLEKVAAGMLLDF